MVGNYTMLGWVGQDGIPDRAAFASVGGSLCGVTVVVGAPSFIGRAGGAGAEPNGARLSS
ncbi:MAG: hypothetical protein ACE5HA_01510 [Anaerolineae bacterium]